ncbi:MAG: hypothetical protein ACTHMZ_07160 [Actinomycetes bacterium]
MISKVVQSLLLGVLVGLLGSFQALNVWRSGTATVPWGVVLALLLAGAAFALMRLWWAPGVAVCAIGALVTALVLGRSTAAGDLVVTGQALGTAWLVGLVGLGFVISLVPLPRSWTEDAPAADPT